MIKDKYLTALEFDKILIEIANHARTKGGAEAVLSIVPHKSKEDIIQSIDLTTEAKNLLDDTGVNSPPLDFAVNPDKIITSYNLSIQNIIDLTKTLTTSRLLKNYLIKNNSADKLNASYIEALISNKQLEDKIYNIFDENFNIKEDATERLKGLYNSYHSNVENLKNTINSLLKNPDFVCHLQDTIYTERLGRTVFQVRASDKNKVRGIVHDVSSSNQTFFIEPEILVGINNKIKQTECEIEAEIQRLLSEISVEFNKIKTEMIIAYKAIVELDVIFAKAKYSIITKSTPPVITNEKILKLHSMVHPLLLKKAPVSNNFILGEDYKALLITGSNTGGKTVTMKTAGLLILMAKSGMHVPCEYAEIYPFKNVYSDIEEKQDITQSLSTFSAHIKNISNILDNITDDDIVLFDELGAGTDPAEGAVLARAILEYLAKKGVMSITTTHLGELKILEYENRYFKNSSVEFDDKTLKPTYKLIIGLAGSSYAIDIAKNYGIKEEIINNARENLSKNSNPDAGIFDKIQKTHEELLSHTKTIKEKKIEAEKTDTELKEKLKEIKEKKKKTLENFKKKYQLNLEIARKEIKETLEELRKEKSEKIARRAYSKLAKLETLARNEFIKEENEISEKYPKINWEEIQIGQNVLVTGINQPAILKKYPDKKGIAEIQIGLIKSKIHISKLAKTDKKVNKNIKKLSVSFDDFNNFQSFNPRLDLRGMRADEALDAVEQHLDLAVRRNISQFIIIHGHGTGVLKKVIREYLKDSPYVLKFRAGEDAEGGDGVSVVDVK